MRSALVEVTLLLSVAYTAASDVESEPLGKQGAETLAERLEKTMYIQPWIWGKGATGKLT